MAREGAGKEGAGDETTVVRIYRMDVALLERIGEMPTKAPFGMKVHVALERLIFAERTAEAVRRVVREELGRLTGDA